MGRGRGRGRGRAGALRPQQVLLFLKNIPLAMQIEEGSKRAGRGACRHIHNLQKTPVLHNRQREHDLFHSISGSRR
jgi:hypothetical protein